MLTEYSIEFFQYVLAHLCYILATFFFLSERLLEFSCMVSVLENAMLMLSVHDELQLLIIQI